MCALVTGVQPFARPIFLLAVCNLGVIASTAPLAAFSAAFGWRGAFLVTAALTVLLFGLSWLAIRDRPATTGNDTPAPETIGQTLRGIGTVLRHPAFPSLFAIFFNVYAIFITILGLWAGPFLHDVYGLDTAGRGNVGIFMVHEVGRG